MSVTPPSLPASAVSVSAGFKSKRIDVIDALRGFALAGIMLLHNVEKFNFMQGPDRQIPFLKSCDPYVWDGFFFLFGGKAYAIFSMLFGFSFWVQYSRMQQKGYDMGARFVWRMALLFSFGVIHSCYYSGDLLIFYAVFGLGLVVVRKAGDTLAFIISACLLLLPLDLFNLGRMLLGSGYVPSMNESWPFWAKLEPLQAHGSFLELSHAYLTNGLKANVIWTWESGRMFHIPGLFLLGMLAARRKAFTDMASRYWGWILGVSLVVFIPLHYVKGQIWGWLEHDEVLRYQLSGIVGPYSDLAMMLAMVSAFILLWRAGIGERIFRVLIPYGRMSLTNYLTQGLTGLILYYGCCFGLYHYLGSTLSMLTGACVLVLQIVFSHWCLRRFGQGPMEKLWRKLMWIGFEKKAS